MALINPYTGQIDPRSVWRMRTHDENDCRPSIKPKMIEFYKRTAFNAAKLSSCERLQVGCVVVTKNENNMYIGYNGTFPGEDNCCEDEHGATKGDVLHAEENAVAKMARSNDSSTGSSIFLTHQPCERCAKLIARIGITELHYANEYRCTKGIDLLKRRGVKVFKM